MTVQGNHRSWSIARPTRGRGGEQARDVVCASCIGWTVVTARQRPGLVLAWVLGLHLVVWTVLPILLCPNLQLDLVEDLALGKEWQLGYWKHPPLPWWIADLVYRLTGDVNAV